MGISPCSHHNVFFRFLFHGFERSELSEFSSVENTAVVSGVLSGADVVSDDYHRVVPFEVTKNVPELTR